MISVIIPLYKVEKFIESCLKSLEQQSYDDFEVLVVNDGSPDLSADIVRKFISKSNCNIRLINQVNKGVSAARNHGIDEAEGEYICFVDSDDMLNLDYLSIMYRCMIENEVGLCVCRKKIINENELLLENYKNPYNVTVYNKEDFLYEMLYGRVKAGIWNLLIRRDVLDGLRFAENFKYSEDLEMVWRLSAKAEQVALVEAPLYLYRERAGSAMTKLNDNRIHGMILFQRLEDYLDECAPAFSPQFKKYGVAKWVWSTLWQEALSAVNYQGFKARIQQYKPQVYMPKLKDFKIKKFRYIAYLYIFSPLLYYCLMRLYRLSYRKCES